MTGSTRCLDDVLVGYLGRAAFPDGTTDSASVYEPRAGNTEAPRAIVKFTRWRSLYQSLGAEVSFVALWLPRSEAVAQGYITGRA